MFRSFQLYHEPISSQIHRERLDSWLNWRLFPTCFDDEKSFPILCDIQSNKKRIKSNTHFHKSKYILDLKINLILTLLFLLRFAIILSTAHSILRCTIFFCVSSWTMSATNWASQTLLSCVLCVAAHLKMTNTVENMSYYVIYYTDKDEFCRWCEIVVWLIVLLYAFKPFNRSNRYRSIHLFFVVLAGCQLNISFLKSSLIHFKMSARKGKLFCSILNCPNHSGSEIVPMFRYICLFEIFYYYL